MSIIEKVAFDVLEGRQGNEPTWDIPLKHPSHHWAVPLAVMEDEQPRRVGTAFHISRLGHLFTARHCVDEALHLNDRARQLEQRLQPVHMASQLVVIRAPDDRHEQTIGLGVETVTGPEPTDLVCLSTSTQTQIPQLTLPLSFALPDAGSTVRCFGFPDDKSDKLFPDFLHVVEGPVKAYFPPGFARGFMRGPCFMVGACMPHGMSGGPVVNEQGAVCGVVSAGAKEFFNEPSCLVTPLYPAVVINVALHARPANNFRISGTLSFLDLCAEGFIPTDGTVDRVHLLTDEQGTEIGPFLSKENSTCVYDSFEDYLAGRQSVPVGNGPRMRIRFHESRATPDQTES